jgi:hypothetical protein
MVINHKNRIFFRFLNVFKFALSICLLVPICRGNVHMYFENIDEPGRSGVEVRWSGAFQHSGNAIPYSRGNIDSIRVYPKNRLVDLKKI